MSEPRELRLSVSKAKTFDQCRRKFYYHYILKLPTILKDYNAIGSLVHLVLEITFKAWQASEYKAVLKQLLMEAWQQAQSSKEWQDAVSFGVTDKAKQYVIAYYKSYYAEAGPSSKPIRCEPAFTLPLKIGTDLKVSVVGYIDRIDQKDYKTLLLLDYKTTNKVQYLDFFQLGIYVAACLYGPYKGYNIEAAYVLLRHDMKLKEMKKPNDTYMKEVDKMVKIATEMDNTINQTKEYPPTFTRLCDYCDHQKRCYEETGGPSKQKQLCVGGDSW
jgi:putative RecB family exonuclease